jgi:glyoxylase-like metal-dependent hydrolase (beta-lactamase superfamily II)
MGISTVALLRIPGRTILFDTGPYAYRPILQARLKRIGVDPGDVDAVVLSHVHWDVAANADLFPHAHIFVHASEIEYADTSASHDALTPAYVGRALRKLKLRPIISEMDMAADVRLVELPGHTPGSIGLLVHNTLLSGDAIYSAREAVAGNPREAVHDAEQARASLAKAVGMAEIIYPGHDRPFRVGPPVGYLSDYTIRMRLFTDPAGQDEEIRIGSFAPKSFASWPVD